MNIAIQIRPSDCDFFGHINNSAYTSFVLLALAKLVSSWGFHDDWKYDGEFAWGLKSMAIEYRMPAVFSDILSTDIWIEEADSQDLVVGCEIK